MNANETSRIISAAGGDAAFARLLGIDKQPGYQQRVNNWKRRGIPPQVVLDHYEVIQRLRTEANADATDEQACPQPRRDDRRDDDRRTTERRAHVELRKRDRRHGERRGSRGGA